MARHQVLQHVLVSCTSAIPHPFCQRHPKIQLSASPVAPTRRFHTHRCRAGSALVALAIPRQSLPRLPTLRVDARLIFDLNNSTTHRNIHTHRQVLRHDPLPSEPLCRNGTTPTPACRNGTTPTPAWTKPSQCIPTLQVDYTHRYALRSCSIDTKRCFLDLHADGLSYSHSLLCLPSHK